MQECGCRLCANHSTLRHLIVQFSYNMFNIKGNLNVHSTSPHICFLRITDMVRNAMKPITPKTKARTVQTSSKRTMVPLRSFRLMVAQRGVHTPHIWIKFGWQSSCVPTVAFPVTFILHADETFWITSEPLLPTGVVAPRHPSRCGLRESSIVAFHLFKPSCLEA